MKKTTWAALVLGIALSATNALAAAGGGWAFGGNIGFINSDQKDMNSAINAMKDTDNASVSTFGNAWEFNGMISYRLQSGTAIMLRPSYFYYGAEEGSGGGGEYSYQLTGFTIFPMLRYFLLEDQTIKFFSQVGVGYGHLTGEVQEQTMDIEFSGGTLGYSFGLGAEFCFFSANHCLNVEGNVRFLSIERMTVDSSTGAAPTGSRFTQIGKSQELEIDGHDFSATMSGVLGMIGYTYNF